MGQDLGSLEPRLLWDYFMKLSGIPRGSGNEAAAARWVAEEATRLGCTVARDAAGNLLVRKPASPGAESAPTVALQAHVDMVCEQNEGQGHDFLRDPIVLVRDGDLIRARGTTLGADDGIGVAAALAVLASDTIRHGPLEVLVTVDEERGLAGAKALQPGILAADYLLSLDTGMEGHLTIGCAGGLDSAAARRVQVRPPSPGRIAFRLKVAGLRGGHSGGEIGSGRGNAIQILAGALWRLAAFDLELAALAGGDKRNAIAREASAVLCLDPGREAGLRAALGQLEQETRAALGSFDPGVALTLEPAALPETVVEPEDARSVTAFLFTMPHGVLAHSPVMAGVVQTSTNLASVTLGDAVVDVRLSHRSSVESSKAAVAERIGALCELAGFELTVGAGYPGWLPDPEAPLVRLVSGVYESLFQTPMRIRASHGGLECGLIGRGHPGLQMVSFGPDIRGNHSPSESLGIASVGKYWRLLTAVLERIGEEA